MQSNLSRANICYYSACVSFEINLCNTVHSPVGSSQRTRPVKAANHRSHKLEAVINEPRQWLEVGSWRLAAAQPCLAPKVKRLSRRGRGF